MSLYNNVKSGEIEGSATAIQLPDIEVGVVWIRADPANGDKVYVGGPGVTAEDGTQDATTGVPLEAGDWTPPLVVKNLSEIWIIGASADDDVFYIASGG